MLGSSGVVGIYLAAGRSTRMGANKLALPLNGKPLGMIALQAAMESKLDHVVIVANQESIDEWHSPVPGYKIRYNILLCEDANRGIAYSIRAGVRFAEERNAAAILIMLADQPFVPVAFIDAMIAQFRASISQGSRLDYIAAEHTGIRQPPALFSASMFASLLALQGDQGAKRFLRADSPLQGFAMQCEDALMAADIDEPEQYRKYKGIHRTNEKELSEW